MKHSLFLIRVIGHHGRWRVSQYSGGETLRNTLGHTHHSSAPPVGTIILMCTFSDVHIRRRKGGNMQSPHRKFQVWPWMGHTHYSRSPNHNLGSPITLMCTGGTFRLDRKVQVSELRFFFSESKQISPSKCLFNLWAMSKLWTKCRRPFFLKRHSSMDQIQTVSESWFTVQVILF